MPYSRLKLVDVKEKYGVDRLLNFNLFKDITERKVSDHLNQTILENRDLAGTIGTEKARSELLIAPVFVELYNQANNQISFFSGVELNVDKERELNGEVDFLFSKHFQTSVVTAPIVMVAEAKRDDFDKGAAQCMAEMIAAKIFNERKGKVEEVYGVITNGTIWQFAQFKNEEIIEVSGDYLLENIEKIIGILWYMTSLES
jgi:hypothetical protein